MQSGVITTDFWFWLALVGGFVVANAVRMRRLRSALQRSGVTATATVVDVR